MPGKPIIPLDRPLLLKWSVLLPDDPDLVPPVAPLEGGLWVFVQEILYQDTSFKRSNPPTIHKYDASSSTRQELSAINSVLHCFFYVLSVEFVRIKHVTSYTDLVAGCEEVCLLRPPPPPEAVVPNAAVAAVAAAAGGEAAVGVAGGRRGSAACGKLSAPRHLGCTGEDTKFDEKQDCPLCSIEITF